MFRINLKKITLFFAVKIIFRLQQTFIKFSFFVTTNVPHNSKHNSQYTIQFNSYYNILIFGSYMP